jgi:hypothetical protein
MGQVSHRSVPFSDGSLLRFVPEESAVSRVSPLRFRQLIRPAHEWLQLQVGVRRTRDVYDPASTRRA